MKIKLTIISIFILALTVNAQDYEMQSRFQKILDYRDTVKKQLIENKTSDIIVKRYFELEPNDIAFLAFDEEEILLIITSQFDILIQDILNRKTRYYKNANLRGIDRKDTQAKEFYRYSRYYYYDSLTITLIHYIKEHKPELINKISGSALQLESKDFILLVLDYYLTLSDFCDIEQEQRMISKSREFLRKYPNSDYSGFVEDYINIEFKEGNWGIGAYYNMGTILYSGGLESYLSNPVLIYFSCDLNYRKFDLDFGMGGTINAKIKNDFYYDTLWQKNHLYTFSPIVGATLGYHVYESKKINISPFIGVRYLGLNGKVKSDSLYYEDIGLDSQNPWTLGVTIDYKFGHGTCKSNYLNRRGGYKERIFADVRFKIAYQNPQLDNLVPDLKGGLWIATLGFGFNSYPPKRIMNKK